MVIISVLKERMSSSLEEEIRALIVSERPCDMGLRVLLTSSFCRSLLSHVEGTILGHNGPGDNYLRKCTTHTLTIFQSLSCRLWAHGGGCAFRE